MGVQELFISDSAQFCGKPHIHVGTSIGVSCLRLNAAPHCAGVQAAEALRWFKSHRFTFKRDCVSESDFHTKLQQLASPIGSLNVAEMAPHLATLTSLQILDLVNNGIGDEGAKALAPHLATLTSLQDLLLGNNGIGDEGVKVLARHLATLTSLKDLYLDKNNISFLAKMKFRMKMFGLRTLEL